MSDPVKIKENGNKTKPIKIPWFNRRQIGLGDVVEKITTAAGMTPCSRCKKRKIIWNKIQIGGRDEPEGGGETP